MNNLNYTIMTDPLFYIGKPKDEENKIPFFLNTYTVRNGKLNAKLSDLLTDDIINTDTRNIALNELYYKNMERVKQQKVPKILPSS